MTKLPEFLARFVLCLLDHLSALLLLRLAQLWCAAWVRVFHAAAVVLHLYPNLGLLLYIDNLLLRRELAMWKRLRALNRRIRQEKAHGGLGLVSKLLVLHFVEAYAIPVSRVGEHLDISPQTYRRYWNQAHRGLSALMPKSRRPHRSPNRTHPSVVRLVWQYHDANPTWGRCRIAMQLWLAGYYVAFSTVYNILNRQRPPFGPRNLPVPVDARNMRHIVSRHPNYLWLLDLTTIDPLGFLGRLLGLKPFYILAIEDHYSRRCFGLWIHVDQPTSQWCTARFAWCIDRYGQPTDIITDGGGQFISDEFEEFCKRMPIGHRLGAKDGNSNTPIERFFHSLKHEALAYFQVFTRPRLEALCASFLRYYNGHRAHFALQGLTPNQAYFTRFPLPPPKHVKIPPRDLRPLTFCEGFITVYEPVRDPPEWERAA